MGGACWKLSLFFADTWKFVLRRDDTELTPWSKEGNELTKMFPLDCPDLHVVLFTRLKVKIRSNAEDKEILINEVKSSFSVEAYNLH